MALHPLHSTELRLSSLLYVILVQVRMCMCNNTTQLLKILQVSRQLYKKSEWSSQENQPLTGGQIFSNSYKVSDWLFSHH